MNRIDIILEETKDRDVLDIGCIDMDKSMYLYNAIKSRARSVTGIDTQKVRGIIQGNFETMKMKRKFSCIIAGEVIEHLDNIGLFLDNCKRHLSPGGKLIITTPNSLSIERIVRHIFTGKVKQDSFLKANINEHTCYFTFEVLERLLYRHGFKISKKLFVNHEIHDKNFSGSRYPKLAKTIHKTKNLFKKLRPHFRDTLLVVAVHKNKNKG